MNVIASTEELATAVLTNFRQVAKYDQIRIHPLVTRLVDPELLKKMGAETTAAESQSKG